MLAPPCCDGSYGTKASDLRGRFINVVEDKSMETIPDDVFNIIIDKLLDSTNDPQYCGYKSLIALSSTSRMMATRVREIFQDRRPPSVPQLIPTSRYIRDIIERGNVVAIRRLLITLDVERYAPIGISLCNDTLWRYAYLMLYPGTITITPLPWKLAILRMSAATIRRAHALDKYSALTEEDFKRCRVATYGRVSRSGSEFRNKSRWRPEDDSLHYEMDVWRMLYPKKDIALHK